MPNFNLPDEICCILHHDMDSGAWVSRCLDFDLVTSGETEEGAWNNLKSVVKLHVEHCFTHNHAALSRYRATDEEFAFFEALASRSRFWSDKIKLNLVAKKKREVPDQLSFWIKGVDSGFCKAADGVPAVH